jgi:hypothetical protein
MKNFILGLCLASLFWLTVIGIYEVTITRTINAELAWCRDVKADCLKASAKANKRR